MLRTEPVIRTEQLRFAYGKDRLVIDDISLTVPSGVTFGLLGQNGAGKSTTLKLLVGLLRPAAGKAYLLGHDLARPEPSLYAKIGMLIEGPPLYPHLSGYDNLRVTGLYRGIGSRRIAEVLHTVGLQAAAHQRVRGYSTGMKQRLGVALALLPDPELLILDEPINGLDPEGIVAMRELVQALGQQQKTILLSSHLLHEVSLTCNYVGIMQQGRLRYQGSIAALKKQYAAQQDVWIVTSDDARARQLLNLPVDQKNSDGLMLQVQKKEEITATIDRLRQAGISIYQVTPQEDNLEKLYFRLTQKHRASTL